MLKYGVVGALAFVVDYSLLYLLTEYANINYILSNTLAFSVSIFVSYFGSIEWVFHSKDTGKKALDVFAFFVIGAIGLGLTDLLIWIFTDFLQIYYLVSKLIATLIVFFYNYFARVFYLKKKVGNGNSKRTDPCV